MPNERRHSMSNPLPENGSSQDSSLEVIVIVLTASVGTVGANSLALGPIAPALAVSYESDVVTIMRAGAAYGLGTAVGALGLSPLIDLFGTRRALLCALVCVAMAFAFSAGATDVSWFILAQALAGLAAGLALPAAYAYAAQIAPAGRESAILGRVLVGWTLSLVIGVSLSALVADLFGWRWVYVIFTCLTVVVLVMLTRIRASVGGKGAEPARSNGRSIGERLTSVTWPHATLHIPGVFSLLLICFAYMMAFYGVYGYIGSHVTDSLGMPVKANGLIALAYGVGFGIAAFGDRVIDQLGVSRVLPWAFSALAVTYGLLALGAPSMHALIAISLIWGLMNHFGLNLIVAGLSAINVEKRGAILGAYSAATYLAASAGTLLFGSLYAVSGFPAIAWLGCGIMAVATAGTIVRRHGA